MPDSTIFALGGAGGDAEPDSYVENSLSTIAGGASWAQLIGDSTGNNHNNNGGTYTYMAFAEMPFKYANAR